MRFIFALFSLILFASTAYAAPGDKTYFVTQPHFNSYSGHRQTDLAGKQAILVSGTNIKTINSTSLLGSGDIAISGGGGTPASTVTTQAYSDAGTVGTATNYAREDHKHGFPATAKDTTAITGLLKGNGAAISAASAGTDYSAASHAHGNITSAGAIGSTTTLPIITGASGVLQAGSFGTAAGTFAQGNDTRLSDTRNTTNALTITTGNGLNGTVGSFNGSAAVTVSHLNTDGNLHVPATSTTNSGRVLTAGATAGALSWVAPSGMTYPGAGVPISSGSAWGTSLNITAISDSTSTTSSTTAASATAVKAAYDLAGSAGLPSQSGQNGKYLTTNGSAASWGTLAGGGDLVSTNNLSDVANAATALANLGGVGAASPTFTGTVDVQNLTVDGVRIATPASVTTCADTGTALPLTSAMIYVATDADNDLDNCTLAAGTAGQVIDIVVITQGSASASLKITPSAAFVGGSTAYYFGPGSPLGKTLSLMYTSGGWMIMSGQAITSNANTATQAPAVTRTYIAGSRLVPANGFKIGSILRWTIEMQKTAASTAAAVIDVNFGTTASTTDTARISWTGAAQTAATDFGTLVITATIRGPLTASCIAAGSYSFVKTATATTGFSYPVYGYVASGAFDCTTANIGAGIAMTPGTAAAWTVNNIVAEIINP
jgi:hypothetical protein